MRFSGLRLMFVTSSMAMAALLESCGGTYHTDPADFSLAATPAALTIQAGGTGSPVSVSVQPVGSFSGAVAVSISGLPAGVTATPASVNVATGGSQNVTLAASSSAAATTATVTFTGSDAGLMHSSAVTLTVQATPPPPPSDLDITTFHDDNSRDGLNALETSLKLSNVNSTQFGKIGFDATDGLVDAEPLYLTNLSAGGSVRNVLFVATEHDSLYAFDADTGAQIWKTSLFLAGETPSDDRDCSLVSPEIGITATPVIDRKLRPNGTIFAVAASKNATGTYHQRLHALDVSTGAEMQGSPTEIAATYPGTGDNSSNGSVVFDPAQYLERAALLLVNGNLYIGFSSHCDHEPYTGWVMAYSESTLQQTQVLNLTPNGSDGSVWMSGGGIAVDGAGSLFLVTGNGTFDTALDTNKFPSQGDYGNAILKLTAQGKLAVADYFEPYNTLAESAADQDLGSGGVMLMPDLTDAQGVVHHLLVGGGKDGNLYVADRDKLGKFNAGGSDNSNLYQELTGVGSLFSTPAFFNGVLYFGTVGAPLRAYQITNARLPAAPSSQTAISFSYPGTSPAVSANGTQNGIVWAVESAPGSPAVLHAYDATNLANELYNSGQAANGRDAFGNGNKFIAPLVVNGKVYVGTPTGVAVFGVLGH
jgi:hypothetical protein